MAIFRPLALIFLFAAAGPASATSTMCMFYGTNGSLHYDIEFIGYGQVAMIQFGSPQGPRSLPGGSYKVLEFNKRARKVHLVYRNPGDPSLLPSFTLKGVGKKVRMSVAGQQVSGELDCDY